METATTLTQVIILVVWLLNLIIWLPLLLKGIQRRKEAQEQLDDRVTLDLSEEEFYLGLTAIRTLTFNLGRQYWEAVNHKLPERGELEQSLAMNELSVAQALECALAYTKFVMVTNEIILKHRFGGEAQQNRHILDSLDWSFEDDGGEG